MEPQVKIEFGRFINAETGRQSVCLEVLNVGEEPIRGLEICFEYEGQLTPEPCFAVGEKPTHVIKSQEMGQGTDFGLVQRQQSGSLEAGKSRIYLFPPQSLKQLRTAVAALAPDNYRVTIRGNGEKDIVMSGQQFREFLRRRFAEPGPLPPPSDEPATDDDRDRTVERLQVVCELAGRIVELNRPIKVYPPREVTQDPSVLQSDDVVQRLHGTKWWLRLSDGTEDMLSFTELMVLTYSLMVLEPRFQELRHGGHLPADTNLSLSFNVAIPYVMKPESVRVLLSELKMVGIHEGHEEHEGSFDRSRS